MRIVKHPSFRYLLLALLTSLLLSSCSEPNDPQSQLQRAIEYRADGKLRSAMIELKNLLQADPKNSRARLELGKLYVTVGQGAAAEKELSRALELGESVEDVIIPLATSMILQREFDRLLDRINIDEVASDQAKVDILLLRGNAYFMLGNNAGARQAFNSANALQGADNTGALVGLTRVAIKENQLSIAEGLISRALQQNQSDSRVWLTRGSLETKRRNYDKAEEAFSRALEIESTAPRVTPTAFSARIGLVQTLLAQKKNKEASEHIEKLMEIAPRHPAPKYFKAFLAYTNGDFDTAATELQGLLAIDPKNKSAMMLLGTVNLALGNLEQADMYLNAFLGAAPDNITARKMLAATRLQLERPEYAVETLTPVIKEGKDDSGLLALMGTAYLRSGDRDAGIKYLEQAVESDPGNMALQKELVTNYIQAGKVNKAVELLERKQVGEESEEKQRRDLLVVLAYLQAKDKDNALAKAQALLKKDPDDPVINNLLGSIMAVMGNTQQALELFKKAVDLRPDYDAALLNLGRLDQQQGRTKRAESYYLKVLQHSPENSIAMALLAQLADKAGNRDQAVQWLQKARKADAGAVDIRLALVRYSLAERKFQQARAIAGEAFNIAPERPDVLNALGVTQMWSREYQKALHSFRRAVELAPDSANILYNLSRAELSLKDFRSAKNNLRKVLKLAPGNLLATTMLVALEMREGNTEGALFLARQQQNEHKNDPTGYVMEGDIHLVRKKYKDAGRAYQAAWNIRHTGIIAEKLYVALQKGESADPAWPLREWLDETPTDLSVREILAKAYYDEGKSGEAIDQYEKILKLKPESPVALNNLAWLYYTTRDSRALLMAEKAHEVSPDNGAITDTLGWLLVETGDVQRGIKVLRQAVNQAPDIPKIRYHLAVALARSGFGQEARQVLNQALISQDNLKDLPEAQKILQE